MVTSVDQIDNRSGYNLWAQTYDTDVNSTVYIDELYFPKLWQGGALGRVLEVGCGTGRHTLKLAREGHSITAIDLSARMLEKARVCLKEFDNTSFIEMDVLHDDMTSLGIFDTAICALVLEHIGNLALFFQKMSCLLKCGGRLYVSEIHPDRIASGTQASFIDSASGEHLKLTSFAHDATQLILSAQAAGFHTIVKSEIFGDSAMSVVNPMWKKHLGQPLIWMLVFEKMPDPIHHQHRLTVQSDQSLNL